MTTIKAFLHTTAIDLAGRIRRFKAAQEATPEQEAALAEAIERVVEETDPRIRLIGGYQKKLRRSVLRALQYADELVEQAPGPFLFSSKTWNSDPQVNACFASVDELQLVFSRSAKLREFFARSPAPESYALLVMTLREKNVLGFELSGEIIRSDVPQTTVSFSEHRIVAPNATLAEARQELEQRALNVLVAQALEHILSLKSQRDALEKRRSSLQIQLKILQARQQGLDPLLHGGAADALDFPALRQELEAVERNLETARANIATIHHYLKQVKTVLRRPEDWFTVRPRYVRLNRLGIKLPDHSAEGDVITLAELSVKARSRVAMLVRFPRNDLLAQEKVWQEMDF